MPLRIEVVDRVVVLVLLGWADIKDPRWTLICCGDKVTDQSFTPEGRSQWRRTTHP